MDATLSEISLEDGRHLGIFLGKNLLAADDEGDLTAQRREQVHEFHTRDARPDDHDVAGQDLGRIGVPGRQDPVGVQDGGVLGRLPVLSRMASASKTS
jgi:hypothetical protein